MTENDKTNSVDTNFSLHCIHYDKKYERKKPKTLQKIPIERSSSSEASREEHPVVE